MASVSSLDKDLRKVRLDKFTPAAANEARAWIEDILGERLPSSDLLECLKDGVALCKLINLALPSPGVKFKQSVMPFVQMENISIFLRACQAPPLNLHQHDTFLTVDLYEQKDPAQVLQCLGAFSRAAHAVNPTKIPSVLGPKPGRGGSVISPQRTGPSITSGRDSLRDRGLSINSNASSAYGTRSVLPHRTGDSVSGRHSPTKSPNGRVGSPGPVSSWSKREHESTTSPAWNIAQYGYIGGASQGNLGISFGSRRQITDSAPKVPSLAAKERIRREKEAEEERMRQEAELAESRRQSELEAEEERARMEEERRWENETQRQREEERRRVEEERRQWEEEERQWRLTEEKRRKAEEEAQARFEEERKHLKAKSDTKLRGQFLSQYQAEHNTPTDDEGGYKSRVRELEEQLEQARQREAEYERERQGRPLNPRTDSETKAKPRSRSRHTDATPTRQDSWSRDEREILHTNRSQHQAAVKASALSPLSSPPANRSRSPGYFPEVKSPRPLPETKSHRPLPETKSRPLPEARSPRPLPHPTRTPEPLSSPRPLPEAISPRPLPDPTFESPKIKPQHTGGRPLPDPATYTSPPSAKKARSPLPEKYTSPPAIPSRSPLPEKYNSRSPQPEPATNTPTPPAQKPRAPIPEKYNSPISQPNRFTSTQTSTPPHQTYSRELSATAQADSEDRRHVANQAAPRAGMSLLEREMELERQRQREWEEAQKETAAAVRTSDGVEGIGGGIGGKWDVNQWTGYTGGDGGNKGSVGIGGGRRQIVGPRPPPMGK